MSVAPSGPAAPAASAVAMRNMAWLLGDKVVALVIGLTVFGLIARKLGPEGSGHFAYATAILQTGLGLSMVCAGGALLPRFCRIQGALPGAVANVFVLRLAASVLAMLAMMIFCVATVDEPLRRTVSLILLLAVPLIEPSYIVATYWLSRNRNRPTMIARSSGLLARATIVVLALWLGVPVWIVAAAWVVEALINATLQGVQFRRAWPGRRLLRFVRVERMRRYLAFGLRFILALWLAQLFLRFDRLVLAEMLEPREFGIYAAPMQLVEVWGQVAYLIGNSIAAAYLYRRMHDVGGRRAFLVMAASMAGIGLLGLGGAWILGPLLLRAVFGAQFAGSYPFLVAGSAFAVLLFADQALDMFITAQNQPWLLALKWIAALSTALLVFWLGFARLGAFVGPVGLAVGVMAGWIALLVLHALRRGRGGTRPPTGLRPVPAGAALQGAMPSAPGLAGPLDRAGHGHA